MKLWEKAKTKFKHLEPTDEFTFDEDGLNTPYQISPKGNLINLTGGLGATKEEFQELELLDQYITLNSYKDTEDEP